MVTEGGTTGRKCGGLVFPDGDVADPNARRGLRRVGSVGHLEEEVGWEEEIDKVEAVEG